MRTVAGCSLRVVLQCDTRQRSAAEITLRIAKHDIVAAIKLQGGKT
jgi:hypothetical protein